MRGSIVLIFFAYNSDKRLRSKDGSDTKRTSKQRVKLLAQRLAEATNSHMFMAQQIVASVSDWDQCLDIVFKCINQERRVTVLVETTSLPARPLKFCLYMDRTAIRPFPMSPDPCTKQSPLSLPEIHNTTSDDAFRFE